MRKIIPAALLAAYLALLFDLTLFRERGAVLAPEDRVRLIPFDSILYFLIHGGRPLVVNVLGNIAAFLPLGFLMPLLRDSPTKASRVALCSMSLSLAIEGLQLFSGFRVADVDDVILNTLGGVLGYDAWAVLGLWARRGR